MGMAESMTNNQHDHHCPHKKGSCGKTVWRMTMMTTTTTTTGAEDTATLHRNLSSPKRHCRPSTWRIDENPSLPARSVATMSSSPHAWPEVLEDACVDAPPSMPRRVPSVAEMMSSFGAHSSSGNPRSRPSSPDRTVRRLPVDQRCIVTSPGFGGMQSGALVLPIVFEGLLSETHRSLNGSSDRDHHLPAFDTTWRPPVASNSYFNPDPEEKESSCSRRCGHESSHQGCS
jgi:hypothetical protein